MHLQRNKLLKAANTVLSAKEMILLKSSIIISTAWPSGPKVIFDKVEVISSGCLSKVTFPEHMLYKV